MAERPDLSAIGGKLVDWEKHTMGEYEDWCEELLTVVRYCRELEAENKRLRADIDEYSHTPEPEMGPWS